MFIMADFSCGSTCMSRRVFLSPKSFRITRYLVATLPGTLYLTPAQRQGWSNEVPDIIIHTWYMIGLVYYFKYQVNDTRYDMFGL